MSAHGQVQHVGNKVISKKYCEIISILSVRLRTTFQRLGKRRARFLLFIEKYLIRFYLFFASFLLQLNGSFLLIRIDLSKLSLSRFLTFHRSLFFLAIWLVNLFWLRVVVWWIVCINHIDQLLRTVVRRYWVKCSCFFIHNSQNHRFVIKIL